MFIRKGTQLFFSLILLAGLILAQLPATPTVMAATSTPTLTWTSGSYAVLAGQTVTLQETSVYPAAKASPSIKVDTLVTLTPPEGVSLAGLRVTAQLVRSGSTPTATITLGSGQTSFWMSAFGGSFGRVSYSKRSGSSETIRLSFTPPTGAAGKTIGVQAQVVTAKSNFFGNTNRWTRSLCSAPATTSVTIAARPEIFSTDIGGPYYTAAADQPREFHLTVRNLANGMAFSGASLRFTITGGVKTLDDVSVFEYFDGANWLSLQPVDKNTTVAFGGTGFEVPANIDLGLSFRIKFATPGAYPFTITLVTNEYPALATFSAVAEVEPQQPTIDSLDLPVNYLAGEPQVFNVTVTNPRGGATISAGELRFTATGKAPADFGLFEVVFPDGSSQALTPAAVAGNAVLAYALPADLAADTSLTLRFRVTFAHPGSYPFSLALLPTSATWTGTATVGATKPILSENNADWFFATGVAEERDIAQNNPTTGMSYARARLNYTIRGAKTADIGAFEYFDPATNAWVATTPLQSGADVTGFIGAASGSALNADGNQTTIRLRLAFNQAGSTQVDFELIDLDHPSPALAALSVFPTIEAVILGSPSLALDKALYTGVPGQATTVMATATYPDYSTTTGILGDLRITLTPKAGVDLAGMVVEAYAGSIKPGSSLGKITLAAGQTEFWLSNFNVTSPDLKSLSNKTVNTLFVFTPANTQAGTLIGISGQVIGAAAGDFGAEATWQVSSDPATAVANYIIGAIPVTGGIKIYLPVTINNR